MCPLNDGIFYLSESATHQEEYFLKHDHYYGTIITLPIGNLKSGLTATRILEENQYNIILLQIRVPLNLLSLYKYTKNLLSY